MTTQNVGFEGIVSDVEFTQIQVYANSTFSDYPFDYAISSTLAIGQSQLNTLIVQTPTLFVDLEISVLSSFTILTYQTSQLNGEISSPVQFGNSQLNYIVYPDSIASTANLIAEVTPPLLIYPQTIYFDDILNEYYSVAIETYSSTSLEEFLTLTSSSISSNTSFDNNIVVRVVTNLNSVEPTLTFGNSQLNLTVYLNSIESTESIGDITQLGMEITDVPFPSITSEVTFGNSKLNINLLPNSIESEEVVSANSQINRNIKLSEWTASTVFGDFVQLNMNIEDVPFPSIESTVEIPNPTIKLFVSPLSIATTANFGTSNFIDNIHRLLVFKDDNISKVGTNDAVVIAGGIRLNPSSTVYEASELPPTPAGFLSVNINGTDYKIPYYGS
jgi:hypothetical protein